MQLLTGMLLILGAFLMFATSLGIIRMPDVLLRISTTTKAVTLGAGCMLAAAALHFWELGTTTRLLATVAFLAMTAPVAAHMIARAAYLADVPLWKTQLDELRGRYDKKTDMPRGEDAPESKPSASG